MSRTECALPVSQEAERAILGAVLLDNKLYAQAQMLTGDDFSLDAHRQIYSRMRDLLDGGCPVDMITLVEELNRHNEVEAIGGVAYLSSLIDGVPERPSIEHYVRIGRDKSVLRFLAHEAEDIQYSACSQDADPDTIVERFNNAAERARTALCCRGAIRRLEDVPDVYSLNAGAISYILPDLIPRGAVVLLTGSPGVGKSSLALKLVIACALGREFLGRQCERIKCLYLDKENPLTLVQQRTDVFAGGPIPELPIWGGWLPDEPPMVEDPRLLRWATEHQLLIVFDSLVRFHIADENSASEMRNVMAHLRRLADAGATVLVLHHRPKTEGNKYRGSSDILAAVDMAYALEEVGGFLRLHRFKSRFSAEKVFSLRANFATGTFELLEETRNSERADDLEAVRRVIADKPGVTTRAICDATKVQGVSRSRTLALLTREMGRLWRQEPGANRSHRYYLLDGVPGAPPNKAAEHRNTYITKKKTNSIQQFIRRSKKRPVTCGTKNNQAANKQTR
jgi:hypothetical protein